MKCYVREVDGQPRLVDFDGHVVTCNVCNHYLRPLGNDLVCSFDCRCLMVGCVPARTGVPA
jgi:hypothetical protein